MSNADFEQRLEAHHVAASLVWDEDEKMLELSSLLGAYLLLASHLGEAPADVDVVELAEELIAIHHRHEAAVRARREAG